MTTGNFVIYWETNLKKKGFVSYDNKIGQVRKEYEPVSFPDASRYKTKSDAERTLMWYNRRGGFGFFIVMKVVH